MRPSFLDHVSAAETCRTESNRAGLVGHPPTVSFFTLRYKLQDDPDEDPDDDDFDDEDDEDEDDEDSDEEEPETWQVSRARRFP
jgi:hypothetical protein